MISPLLIAALIAVESGGNDSAVGKNGELGCLQIKPGVVEDCNRVQNLLHFLPASRLDREASCIMCQIYLQHYATTTTCGHEPTDEDYARMWNGGPLGWQRVHTETYWQRVRAVMQTLTPAAPAAVGFNISAASVVAPVGE